MSVCIVDVEGDGGEDGLRSGSGEDLGLCRVGFAFE